MGVDNGKPLGRAPKPAPLTADGSVNADNGNNSNNNNTEENQTSSMTTESEDITFTF